VPYALYTLHATRCIQLHFLLRTTDCGLRAHGGVLAVGCGLWAVGCGLQEVQVYVRCAMCEATSD
jgi:hypothetical protein